MSQITRCPFCATTFKVVADQLRISDGWVRCGQCKEVFDASEHLILGEHEPLLPELPLHDLRAPIQPAARTPDSVHVWGSARAAMAPAASEELPPLPDAANQPEQSSAAGAESEPPGSSVPALLVAEPMDGDGDAGADGYNGVSTVAGHNQGLTPLSFLLKREALPEPQASVGPSQQEMPGYEPPGAPHGASTWPQDAVDDSQVEPEAAVQAAVHASPQEQALVSAEASDESAAQSALQGLELLQPEPIPAEEAALIPAEALVDVAQAEAAAAPAEPGFVTAARRSVFWRRPLVRGVLAFMGLCLMLALGMQMALQERDVIAARVPAARALMEQFCRSLQCTLQPPRRIDAVVIDSSSFLKARHDAAAYQLQMGIKNTSTLTVAMPALELTLTDAQDQTLLRRVLLRDELGAPAQLAPGATWSGAVPMQVMQDASRVAGYRLLAFYP